MKLKIVIKVPISSCEKSKSKAMQIAVAAHGVSSVSVGKENDQIEVIGEGVDAVCLAVCLRKKFCFADIVTVEEVKPPKPQPEKPCPLPCPTPPCPPPCPTPPCACPPYGYQCWVCEF